jgi:hypothetical protein
VFNLNDKENAMASYGKKASKKVEEVMHEKKAGTLKSGSGKKVTSRKQAIAIALSEARKEGDKVPPPKKTAAKKTAAKKTAAKKAPAKKAAAKKTTARKAPAKKAAAKKTSARKTSGSRSASAKKTG